MPAPAAGIHVLKTTGRKDRNGRNKPGHDESVSRQSRWYNEIYAALAEVCAAFAAFSRASLARISESLCCT